MAKRSLANRAAMSRQEKMVPVRQAKVSKVMHEWKAGGLHSGSKSGPKVKSQKQAVAIGLSEARKAAR